MRVSWQSGVSVEYKDAKVIIDPQNGHIKSSAAFITHAHLDHSRGFRLSHLSKFSSEETMKLVSIHQDSIEGWQPLTMHKKVAVGDIEVIPHDSGHVLGSQEFEIVTPEGSMLFTGDFNTKHTKTMRPAEPVSCDILAIESTFGAPQFRFPSEEVVAKDMINWAQSTLDKGRIPVFRTDPLGNAQEIISLFNEFTEIPVVTHWKVSGNNAVYRSYGHKLECFDEKSDEANEIVSSGNLVFVAPKNFALPNITDFAPALVSGWALWSESIAFPLSDHADFPQLMEFIENCNPEIVLTSHSGKFDQTLAKYIEKNLGMRAYPIQLIPTSLHSRWRQI